MNCVVLDMANALAQSVGDFYKDMTWLDHEFHVKSLVGFLIDAPGTCSVELVYRRDTVGSSVIFDQREDASITDKSGVYTNIVAVPQGSLVF
jgi:hypothetical protein